MPTSVVAAVAASVVSDYVVGVAVLEWGMGALASSALGAVAGGLTSVAVGAAFSDAPDQGAGDQQFQQELRDNLVTVRQPITHWQYIWGRTRASGALTFGHESADNNLHLIITFAGHVSSEIEAIQFNDELVPLDGDGNATGRYAGYVRIKKSLGDEAGQPFPDLVLESEGKWTDAHRQSGRTKIYVRLTFNIDIFPTGLPNITAIIKGRKVYDPRTGLTAWSDNASLCQADFLCDQVAGVGCVYADEIDETQLIAAANIDDEPVTLAAGGTEARYTLNGTSIVNVEPRATLGRMLTANAGKARYIGGVWLICPAAYVVPTITISEDDLRSVPHVNPRLSASDLSNAVKGVYVNEDNFWQASDFPPITNATYLIEDNDERSWRELSLPFTKSPATAQRIAKIELEKMRQQISVDWPGKFNCYRLQAGDTVKITFPLLGWSEKVFEVDQSRLVFETEARAIRLGTDLVLREIASTVFDWSAGEETAVDPAPDTNLPDPFVITAPGVPEVVETLYETTGSAGVKARATMSWAIETGIYRLDYLPEYRIVGGDWIALSPTVDASVQINDIAPGSYEFRLRQRNSLGVRSSYSGTRTKQIVGLTALPADPEDFYLVAVDGGYEAEWSLSADLDVRIGGRAVIRHTPATTGATWSDGIVVREFNGDAVEGRVPMMAGTYMLKFKDSTGNWSDGMASFVPSEAMLTGYSTVGTSTQHSGFTGTKTGCAVIDSTLQIAGTTLIDDMTDLIDDWPKLDGLGGIASAASYAFDTYLDMTTVAARRFDATITAIAFDTGDLIDDRTALIDDWDDFDGNGDINDCDATLWISTTDDDPAGAPTWGAWTPFFVGEFVCRAARFRLDMVSGNPTHTLAVSALSVRARIPT